jgi:hypothetical protein
MPRTLCCPLYLPRDTDLELEKDWLLRGGQTQNQGLK